MKTWWNQIRHHPKETFDSFRTILLAVFIALVFRYSVAAPYKIPSGSMIPTLKIGDFIFVSKLGYGLKLPFTNINLIDFDPPKRGDVIVFIFPGNRKLDYVKRVVALAGDTVETRDGVVYVNGSAMAQEPVMDKSILSDLEPPEYREFSALFRETLGDRKHLVMHIDPIPRDFGPETVPPKHLFVMGDNRDNSQDSRFWGYLPQKNVRGRALFVWLSIDSQHPYVSFTDHIYLPRIRWERFGMRVF